MLQIYVIDLSGVYSHVNVSIILYNAMCFRIMKKYDSHLMLSKDYAGLNYSMKQTFLEKLTVPQLVMEFHASYAARRFTVVFARSIICRHRTNPVRSIKSFFFEINTNIIFPSRASASKQTLSFRFPTKNFSPPSCVLHDLPPISSTSI